jgi:hypothetical protein
VPREDDKPQDGESCDPGERGRGQVDDLLDYRTGCRHQLMQDAHRPAGHRIRGHCRPGRLRVLTQGRVPGCAEGEPGVQLGGEQRGHRGDQGVGHHPGHPCGEGHHGEAGGDAHPTAAEHEADEGG